MSASRGFEELGPWLRWARRRRRGLRAVALAVAVSAWLVVGSAPAWAGRPQDRVFGYREARQARELARRECAPLVIHVYSGSPAGRRLLDDFYERRSGIPPALLERVVVLTLPREKYGDFARQLGITEAGGMRTISPYDLSLFGYEAATTQRETPAGATRLVCRPGFR